MSKIKAELMEVTPHIAAGWLDKNTYNRRMYNTSVRRYEKIMKEGRWKLNGEAIKIAEDGTLLDGQHRLRAVVEANVNVPMLVIKGLPRDTFSTIDTGKKRTGGDIIGILDESSQKYQYTVAAACKVLDAFSSNGVYKGRRHGNFEHDEMMKILEKNRGILRSAQYAHTLAGARKICPTSLIATMHYLFSKKDVNMAEQFFSWLDTGAELKINHPVYVLRRRLYDMRERGARLDVDKTLPYVVRAWDFLRDRQEISRLLIPDDFVPTIK